MKKLTTLPLTESELFFGILLVLLTGMMCVSIGMLGYLMSLMSKKSSEQLQKDVQP